jgi:cytochrome c oxidase assembly protein subunit 15
LLLSGGLVTSKGVGMTVPDWPNSYGYNMFLFPLSRWVGGIFYEHVHRLIASGVGLMTILLAISLWMTEPRKWVRVLGYIAVVTVVVQGVLGGLRVTIILDDSVFSTACWPRLIFRSSWLLPSPRAEPLPPAARVGAGTRPV